MLGAAVTRRRLLEFMSDVWGVCFTCESLWEESAVSVIGFITPPRWLLLYVFWLIMMGTGLGHEEMNLCLATLVRYN